jgi:FAD/FMN-containing dehydrogenase
MSLSTLHEHLAARLGPKGWSTDPEVLAPMLAEWRGRWHGTTPFLAMPATTAEAQAVVQLCAAAGAAITPQGGNTGLVGGQIPDGEILVSLKRMNRIRSIDPIDDALTAEAGAVLAAVQDAAAGADRLFPLSLGSQGSATIGGLISTNAGGVHVVRYGMMRDLVLGLEVVLPSGEIWNGLKALRKDNTGYDLKQMFIGAEGTLGLVTAATLKLFPRPSEHVVAMAGFMDAERWLDLLHLIKSRTGALAAFEVMNRLSVDLAVAHIEGVRDPFMLAPSWVALIECESAGGGHGLESAVEEALAEALEAGIIVDAAVARSEAQAAAYWRLRESIPAAHKRTGRPQMSFDIATPVSAAPRFVAIADAATAALLPGARSVAFGHAGDGNIHYTVMAPAETSPEAFAAALPAIVAAVQGEAMNLNGSISAEHGVGVARRDELPAYKSPIALAMMKTVKAALDPQRIMNPRAMLQP